MSIRIAPLLIVVLSILAGGNTLFADPQTKPFEATLAKKQRPPRNR